MQTYVPLHNHSHGSLLDGFASVGEHVSKAAKDGAIAFGLTDHGECSMHGDLQTAAFAHGIKPIFGTEAYFVDDVHLSRQRKDKPASFSHACLWAIDNKGLENLWTLSTISHDEDHMYYRPRMDWTLLAQYNEGLAVSDGCLLAEVARAVNDDDDERAIQYLQTLISLFGKENVFIELHTWQFIDPVDDSQKELNRQMTKANHGKLRLAKKLGLKTIAVNDAHYSDKDDYIYHELVWESHASKGVDAMADTLSDDGAPLGRGQTASWLMDEEEVRFWLAKHGIPESDIDDAIQNTWDFAQRVNVTLDNSPKYPLVTNSFEDDIKLFNKTLEEGFANKVPSGKEEEYRERLEYEKEVILTKKFEGYFNVVSDYSRYTKRKDTSGVLGGKPGKESVIMGPGRGSSGGSLVAYLMDITEIDPIKHQLPFERFLSMSRGLDEGYRLHFSDTKGKNLEDTYVNVKKNTEAAELEVGDEYAGRTIVAKEEAMVGDFPDIDSDFPSKFSDNIIEYLRYRYGPTSVAKIGTRQTSQVKNVFKDLARAYGVDYQTANLISRQFPPDISVWHFNEGLPKLFGDAPELYRHESIIRRIAPHVTRMLNRVRQSGSHASGYVISNHSLLGKIPMRYKDGELITQFPPRYVGVSGYIKYDILKIKALDIVEDTVREAISAGKVVRRYRNNQWEYRNINDVNLADGYEKVTEYTSDIIYSGATNELNDPNIWADTREGDSLGIFQLETDSGQSMAKQMQIMNLEDAAVLSAVNRPGMTRSGLAYNFFKRRKGEEAVDYPHPFLEKIVGKTQGYFVFQEDVMRLFTELAGYSMEEADYVRSVISKKDEKSMVYLKNRLISYSKKDPEFVRLMPEKYDTVEACVEDIWKMIEHSVVYSFNRSHAVSYAVVGGWQAWLKYNFLQEFIQVSVQHNTGELKQYINYAKSKGIKFLPPDINKSKRTFTVEGNDIRCPLNIISHVGPRAIDEIIAGQPFESIEDFESKTSGRNAKRINVYKNLIIAGAFDEFENDREKLLNEMFISKGRGKMQGAIMVADTDVSLSNKIEISKAEEAVMGHSFSYDPMSQVEAAITVDAVTSMQELAEVQVYESFITYGKALAINIHRARNGPMAWITLEIKDGSTLSITVFADMFQHVRHLFAENDVLLVKAKRDKDYNDSKSFIALEIVNMTDTLA